MTGSPRRNPGKKGDYRGYWGGYSLLSLSPTHRALPGKVENLTPPAAGQKRTGWSTASADRATLERCQPEPLHPDQCQRQQPGTGTGSRHPPPTICTGTHPAQQIAPLPPQTEGQSSSAPRAAALAFFFCLAFPPAACPACRISSPARAGCCRRCHDDHASTPQPQQITPAATCTGKDQHRQRRTR